MEKRIYLSEYTVLPPNHNLGKIININVESKERVKLEIDNIPEYYPKSILLQIADVQGESTISFNDNHLIRFGKDCYYYITNFPDTGKMEIKVSGKFTIVRMDRIYDPLVIGTNNYLGITDDSKPKEVMDKLLESTKEDIVDDFQKIEDSPRVEIEKTVREIAEYMSLKELEE